MNNLNIPIYVAVDKDGDEVVFSDNMSASLMIMLCEKVSVLKSGKYATKILPKGSIEKLIGKKLTWEDEPVELKEQL
jgi:hypothetical protein